MNNLSSLNNVNNSKLNLNNLNLKTKSIRASNEIFKIHRYYLDQRNNFLKTKNNELCSPFSLFSKKAPIKYSFKLSPSIASDLTDKITAIGHWENPQNPLQDFIKSLSLPPSNTEIGVSSSSEAITNTYINDLNKLSSKEISNSKFSTEIVEIVSENHEFKTLRLKRPAGWNFQAGQYLEIKSEPSSAKKPAILAIASGTNEEYIEITAKPNANPDHPNYCLNGLIGDNLIINGPLGTTFPLDLITPETPVVLLGGGSGLTALKSLMESIPFSTDAKLIYTAKAYNDLIYKDEIEKWKSEGHIISLTQDKVEGFAEGRIGLHLKSEELKPNTLFFLCGPKKLVLETTKLLAELGIPREMIYGSLPVTAEEGGPIFRGDHPKMILV